MQIPLRFGPLLTSLCAEDTISKPAGPGPFLPPYHHPRGGEGRGDTRGLSPGHPLGPLGTPWGAPSPPSRGTSAGPLQARPGTTPVLRDSHGLSSVSRGHAGTSPGPRSVPPEPPGTTQIIDFFLTFSHMFIHSQGFRTEMGSKMGSKNGVQHGVQNGVQKWGPKWGH